MMNQRVGGAMVYFFILSFYKLYISPKKCKYKNLYSLGIIHLFINHSTSFTIVIIKHYWSGTLFLFTVSLR